jgi:hypothetical protein
LLVEEVEVRKSSAGGAGAYRLLVSVYEVPPTLDAQSSQLKVWSLKREGKESWEEEGPWLNKLVEWSAFAVSIVG